MRYRLCRAVLFCATVLFAVTAHPAPPATLAYQGYLTTVAGTPLDATVTVTFRLYTAAGSQVWSEVQSVHPANGLYSVMLGSVSSLAALPFDQPYLLGIAVGSDPEMTPRQVLASSPYAFRAITADSATTAVSANTATTALTANTATTALSATTAGSAWGLICTGCVTAANMASGVAGVVPWVPVSAAAQQSASNAAYLVTGAVPATITLPASPVVGDVVKASAASNSFTLKANIGQTIGGITNVAPVTWTARASSNFWQSVTSSADGRKLVAAAYGLIYTSTDSGLTWTARDSMRTWLSVASSADGSKLVAAVNSGQIYTSTDSGATWTARDSVRDWSSVASSADGSKLVAVVRFGGQIYTSTDSGLTWTARDSMRTWTSVASSADGSKLVAVDYGGQIYTSTDSGLTWTPRDSARSWMSVASSADGSKLVAAVDGGQLYTWAGTAVLGDLGSSVELLYTGAGHWQAVNQQGMLTLQ